jgi:CRISPR-associated protein Csm1
MADNLSSKERSKHADGHQDFRTTVLSPIFDRIHLRMQDDGKARFIPQADHANLDSEPAIFPMEGRHAPIENITRHIRAFGEAFVKMKDTMRWDSFDCVYSHILSLLNRFAACIASDTQTDPPDIPLYDHLRISSAIAACLYKHHAEKGTLKDETLRKPSSEPCALLVGDLSGIQKYLYDIAKVGAGGVARRLRARSFFLQMLAEIFCLKALRLFSLPPSAVIMSSGGKFYMLIPNLDDTGDKVSRLKSECDKWLLEKFHGALALNLAWTTLHISEFSSEEERGGFGSVLARLYEIMAKNKHRRLDNVLTESNEWQEDQFLREPFPSDSSLCVSCRRFPAVAKSDPDGEADICGLCRQDLRLGRNLPIAHYIGFYDRALADGFSCFDWSFTVRSDPNFPIPPVLAIRLNNLDLQPLGRLPASFRLLANHVPLNERGESITFEEIAAGRAVREDESAPGLLAVVKADVDLLGLIFQEGLKGGTPPSYDTPSRLASLSRQFDLFFSGWIEWLLATEYRNTYTVYSGGDDLLLVAPQSQALGLMSRIREAFRDFTGNPEITLSAGIALVKPNLPMAHTAKSADKILSRAKAEGRNRLCILGSVIPWDDLPLLLKNVELLEKENPPSSFLYNLLQFAHMWRDWQDRRNPQALRFQALLAYSLGRNFPRNSRIFEWGSRLIGFPISTGDSGPRKVPCEEEKIMDHLGLIASWVILGRRMKDYAVIE